MISRFIKRLITVIVALIIWITALGCGYVFILDRYSRFEKAIDKSEDQVKKFLKKLDRWARE